VLQHKRLQQYKKSLQCFQAARRLLRPNTELLGSMALSYQLEQKGSWQNDAASIFEEMITMEPTNPQIYHNLAEMRLELGRFEEAQKAYLTSIRLSPQGKFSTQRLGDASLYLGRFGDAHRAYQRSFALRRGMPYGQRAWWSAPLQADCKANDTVCSMEDPRNDYENHFLTAAHKLYHDAAQFEHLQHVGLLPTANFSQAIRNLRSVADELNTRSDKDFYGLRPLQKSQQELLCRVHNRNVHQEIAFSMLPDAATNQKPRQVLSALEDRYLDTKALDGEVIHVDDFLRSETLHRLRSSLLNSTVWTAIKPAGYLGSYLPDGFSSPLLYQVAEELRTMFPRIFRDHRLRLAWAYKSAGIILRLKGLEHIQTLRR